MLLASTALLSCFASDSFAQSCRAPMPGYCGRQCWNARSPKCSVGYMGSLNRAVIHHTASAGDYNTGSQSTSASNVRGLQNYHMDANGWCDVGYHFLVDKLGNIFAGRFDSGNFNVFVQGAHDSCNGNSFGFTCMGYFHPPYNQQTTTALKAGLKQIIAGRMPGGWNPKGTGTTYCSGVVDKVLGHRQVYATACPGDILHNQTKDGSGFEDAIADLRICN
jgi:hypothetical protein